MEQRKADRRKHERRVTADRRAGPSDYKAISWPADSLLNADEQAHVNRQRRALWDRGIRKEPQLTRMAFEFGAAAAMLEQQKKLGSG